MLCVALRCVVVCVDWPDTSDIAAWRKANPCCRQVILKFHEAGNKFSGGWFEHLKSLVKEKFESDIGTASRKQAHRTSVGSRPGEGESAVATCACFAEEMAFVD